MEGDVAVLISLLGLRYGQNIAIGRSDGYEHCLRIGTLVYRFLRGALHIVIETNLDRWRSIGIMLFDVRECRTIFIDHGNGPASLTIDLVLDRRTHARHKIGRKTAVAGNQGWLLVEAHTVHAFHLGTHSLGLVFCEHSYGERTIRILQFLGQILGINLCN